jgi:D-alanyl-D-alanine carboxypeptidase
LKILVLLILCKKINIGGYIFPITNKILQPSSEYYYKYATGIKTVFHNEFGFCIIFSSENFLGFSYIYVNMCAFVYKEKGEIKEKNFSMLERRNFFK